MSGDRREERVMMAIEVLVEEERQAAKKFRAKYALTEDPWLKSLYAELAARHEQCRARLETYLAERASQAVIIREINEMFF